MKLKDYIQGERRGKDANKLEREALNNPFLQDAIEGFDAVDGNQWHAIENLEAQVNRKIKTKENSGNNRYQLIGIAASIALLIGFGSLVYFNLHNRSEKSTIAKLQTTPEELEKSWDYATEEELMETKSMIDSAPVIAELTPPAPLELSLTDDNDEALSAIEIVSSYVSTEEEKAVYDLPLTEEALKKEHNWSADNRSEPPFGEKEFKEYFEKNRSKNICSGEKASIEAHFYVDETGAPANLKIEKSTCDELEKELIKLLATSPKWTTTGREVKLEIQLK